LPPVLDPRNNAFITAKQFGRLKSLQAAQTIKNYDQDGAQDSLKQGIKHFEESIKDAGGDAFEKVHSSSHSLFSTTGYGVDLRALVKNPNEDEVFHVLPGHKNAESAQEKNSFYKAQLERLEKLRRDHENLLAKYNQFIEQCKVRGYDRSSDNKTSKELDSLVTERAKIDGRLKLLNIAIPKFEKAVKDTQRVIDHDIAAVVKGAVRNKGVTHEGKDIKTLIALARREDSSKYSGEELNNPTVLEATSSQNTPYPFGVADKAKIGKIAEIEIRVNQARNAAGDMEGTYRKAYVEQVHDVAAVNGKRDRTYCAGEPKAENTQELYSYAFNVVANDLANMDVKPGKKDPLTKTPVRYIIRQNDPDKAKAYYTAAIYHGVDPKHIKVISDSFSPANADVYTKSWGTVKLNEQYKTLFDNVYGSAKAKEMVDSAQAVKRPNTLRNRVYKPKTEEGKEARQKKVDLEKGVEKLKRSSDKVSSDADKNLDDAVSGNNPNAKDEDYTGMRLR